MENTIKVAVRLRPLVEREQSNGLSNCWKEKDNTTIVQLDEGKETGNTFKFDRVFNGKQTSREIFGEIVKPIVLSAMGGFHGTVFAYGQTCSGKTFTMSGTKEHSGIIPLSIQAVFEAVDCTPHREYLFRVSYMEIYNEKITDLLIKDDKILKLQEDQYHQISIVGLKEELVTSAEQVINLISKADVRRSCAETAHNEYSSRSHCIFRMIIESRDRQYEDLPSEEAVMVSHLFFVDLAGSEKASENSGERFREGCAINRSLLTLGQVISKLSEGLQDQYVGYRDSKLTRILQNALGGNSKTVIICTLNPTSVDQTVSTLRFASRAKVIENKPHVNEVLSDAALLKRYRSEIEHLQEMLSTMGIQGIQMEKEDLEKQLEEKRRLEKKQCALISRLKEFICVSTIPEDATPAKKIQRRETWFGGRFKRNLLQKYGSDQFEPNPFSLAEDNGRLVPNKFKNLQRFSVFDIHKESPLPEKCSKPALTKTTKISTRCQAGAAAAADAALEKTEVEKYQSLQVENARMMRQLHQMNSENATLKAAQEKLEAEYQMEIQELLNQKEYLEMESKCICDEMEKTNQKMKKMCLLELNIKQLEEKLLITEGENNFLLNQLSHSKNRIRSLEQLQNVNVSKLQRDRKCSNTDTKASCFNTKQPEEEISYLTSGASDLKELLVVAEEQLHAKEAEFSKELSLKANENERLCLEMASLQQQVALKDVSEASVQCELEEEKWVVADLSQEQIQHQRLQITSLHEDISRLQEETVKLQDQVQMSDFCYEAQQQKLLSAEERLAEHEELLQSKTVEVEQLQAELVTLRKEMEEVEKPFENAQQSPKTASQAEQSKCTSDRRLEDVRDESSIDEITSERNELKKVRRENEMQDTFPCIDVLKTQEICTNEELEAVKMDLATKNRKISEMERKLCQQTVVEDEKESLCQQQSVQLKKHQEDASYLISGASHLKELLVMAEEQLHAKEAEFSKELSLKANENERLCLEMASLQQQVALKDVSEASVQCELEEEKWVVADLSQEQIQHQRLQITSLHEDISRLQEETVKLQDQVQMSDFCYEAQQQKLLSAEERLAEHEELLQSKTVEVEQLQAELVTLRKEMEEVEKPFENAQQSPKTASQAEQSKCTSERRLEDVRDESSIDEITSERNELKKVRSENEMQDKFPCIDVLKTQEICTNEELEAVKMDLATRNGEISEMERKLCQQTVLEDEKESLCQQQSVQLRKHQEDASYLISGASHLKELLVMAEEQLHAKEAEFSKELSLKANENERLCLEMASLQQQVALKDVSEASVQCELEEEKWVVADLNQEQIQHQRLQITSLHEDISLQEETVKLQDRVQMSDFCYEAQQQKLLSAEERLAEHEELLQSKTVEVEQLQAELVTLRKEMEEFEKPFGNAQQSPKTASQAEQSKCTSERRLEDVRDESSIDEITSERNELKKVRSENEMQDKFPCIDVLKTQEICTNEELEAVKMDLATKNRKISEMERKLCQQTVVEDEKESLCQQQSVQLKKHQEDASYLISGASHLKELLVMAEEQLHAKEAEFSKELSLKANENERLCLEMASLQQQVALKDVSEASVQCELEEEKWVVADLSQEQIQHQRLQITSLHEDISRLQEETVKLQDQVQMSDFCYEAQQQKLLSAEERLAKHEELLQSKTVEVEQLQAELVTLRKEMEEVEKPFENAQQSPKTASQAEQSKCTSDRRLEDVWDESSIDEITSERNELKKVRSENEMQDKFPCIDVLKTQEICTNEELEAVKMDLATRNGEISEMERKLCQQTVLEDEKESLCQQQSVQLKKHQEDASYLISGASHLKELLVMAEEQLHAKEAEFSKELSLKTNENERLCLEMASLQQQVALKDVSEASVQCELEEEKWVVADLNQEQIQHQRLQITSLHEDISRLQEETVKLQDQVQMSDFCYEAQQQKLLSAEERLAEHEELLQSKTVEVEQLQAELVTLRKEMEEFEKPFGNAQQSPKTASQAEQSKCTSDRRLEDVRDESSIDEITSERNELKKVVIHQNLHIARLQSSEKDLKDFRILAREKFKNDEKELEYLKTKDEMLQEELEATKTKLATKNRTVVGLEMHLSKKNLEHKKRIRSYQESIEYLNEKMRQLKDEIRRLNEVSTNTICEMKTNTSGEVQAPIYQGKSGIIDKFTVCMLESNKMHLEKKVCCLEKEIEKVETEKCVLQKRLRVFEANEEVAENKENMTDTFKPFKDEACRNQ